jgi:hypothetical protein
MNSRKDEKSVMKNKRFNSSNRSSVKKKKAEWLKTAKMSQDSMGMLTKKDRAKTKRDWTK